MINIYTFYFNGIEQPISIEAENKNIAKQFLQAFIQDKDEYRNVVIVNEKVETPVSGITRKKLKGKNYVWYDSGANAGWVQEEVFNMINKK